MDGTEGWKTQEIYKIPLSYVGRVGHQIKVTIIFEKLP